MIYKLIVPGKVLVVVDNPLSAAALSAWLAQFCAVSGQIKVHPVFASFISLVKKVLCAEAFELSKCFNNIIFDLVNRVVNISMGASERLRMI